MWVQGQSQDSPGYDESQNKTKQTTIKDKNKVEKRGREVWTRKDGEKKMKEGRDKGGHGQSTIFACMAISREPLIYLMCI